MWSAIYGANVTRERHISRLQRQKKRTKISAEERIKISAAMITKRQTSRGNVSADTDGPLVHHPVPPAVRRTLRAVQSNSDIHAAGFRRAASAGPGQVPPLHHACLPGSPTRKHKGDPVLSDVWEAKPSTVRSVARAQPTGLSQCSAGGEPYEAASHSPDAHRIRDGEGAPLGSARPTEAEPRQEEQREAV